MGRIKDFIQTQFNIWNVVLTPSQQSRRPVSPMTTSYAFPTIPMSTMTSSSSGNGRLSTSRDLARRCVWPRSGWTAKTSIIWTLALIHRPNNKTDRRSESGGLFILSEIRNLPRRKVLANFWDNWPSFCTADQFVHHLEDHAPYQFPSTWPFPSIGLSPWWQWWIPRVCAISPSWHFCDLCYNKFGGIVMRFKDEMKDFLTSVPGKLLLFLFGIEVITLIWLFQWP